jgi:Family of unknown function (DUF6325)
MYGPVDYIVVDFPGNKFKGDIIPELEKLVESDTIRIIDLIFITKDSEGHCESLELSDMSPEIVEYFSPLRTEEAHLLAISDIEVISELLPNESSAGILVYENVWARGFKKAVLDAEGILIADGRIHEEDLKAAYLDSKNNS